MSKTDPNDFPRFPFVPGCCCRNCGKYPEFNSTENLRLIREKAAAARAKLDAAK